MAYSNWGAYVFKNGKRREDKENVGVFDTEEAHITSGFRIFYNILKNEMHDEVEWYTHSHHAVLGDGRVRLCGYKYGPELYYIDEKDKIREVKIKLSNHNEEDEIGSGKIIIGKGTWKWSYKRGFNIVELKLVEPDGVIWESKCGLYYGAGHYDEDDKEGKDK